jgi:hypothetical protein
MEIRKEVGEIRSNSFCVFIFGPQIYIEVPARLGPLLFQMSNICTLLPKVTVNFVMDVKKCRQFIRMERRAEVRAHFWGKEITKEIRNHQSFIHFISKNAMFFVVFCK